MEKSYQGPLGKSLLAGLLTGIIAAVIVLIYDVIYRRQSDFYTYEVVMPLSIFLSCPLFELLAGGVYYMLAGHLRMGSQVFTIIFILLTIISAVATAFTNRAHEEFILTGFRGLLIGIEGIVGLLGAFLIPWFARHPRIYTS